MWWDDAWAVVALFADMASLVSVILEHHISGSKIIIELGLLDTNSLAPARFHRTVGRWIGSCAFPTVIWWVYPYVVLK